MTLTTIDRHTWTDECDRLRRAVVAHQQDRSAKIMAALGGLDDGWTPRLPAEPRLRSALLHHALYQAMAAAESGDEAGVERALALCEIDCSTAGALVPTNVGPVAVTTAAACRRRDDPRMLSPVYSPTPESLVAGAARDAALRDAIDLIAGAGFGPYLSSSLAVVVWLQDRELSDTLESYSLTPFPGTVYSDFVDDSARLGESLLHETIHCWFNDCLRARGVELPPEPRWFSPWKGTMRPAFGLLHAVVTFSILTWYLRSLLTLPSLPPRSRAYCEVRLGIETERVAGARRTYEEALRLVGDPLLTRWLEQTIFDSANEAPADPAGAYGASSAPTLHRENR